MNMDQAAVFLAGSVLFSVGATVLVAAVVLVNNIIHKYWKSVTMVKWVDYNQSARFATADEMAKIAPRLEPIETVEETLVKKKR